MSFIVKDVAGHTFRVSTDLRHPPAMDAMPPGMRRRPARDQGAIGALGRLVEGGALGALGGGGGGKQEDPTYSNKNDFRGPEGSSDQDPDQVTPEDIADLIVACLAKFEGTDRDQLLQHLGEIVQAGQSGDAAFGVRQPRVSADRPGYTRGAARVGGAHDHRPPAMDSRNHLAKRDPALWGMMSKIRLGGR